MKTTIALLRGVNVGGKGKVNMQALRAMCEGMGLKDVRTYIQSGNIVFRAPAGDWGVKLAKAIEKEFGVTTMAVTRTEAELRAVMEKNPIPGVEPNKLLVVFLNNTPAKEAVAAVAAMGITPETIHILGSEMYIYFPHGQGQSRLPMAKIERTLGATGTGRNWNTVGALLQMAEEA